MTVEVLHVRHVLARWRANDWRRAFALTDELDGSLRAACDVPSHGPLTDNTGALAMPLLRQLGEFNLEQLVQALRPLLEQLARTPQGLTPGLVELTACDLLPSADVTEVVAELDEAQARAVSAAERALADVQAGRPVDLTDLQAWNTRLEHIDDVVALRNASLAAETQALVEKADPRTLKAVQRLLADG